MNRYTKLHNELVAAIEEIASCANEAHARYVRFSIEASGSVGTERDRDDMLAIKYRIGDYDTHAEGGELGAVLLEYLRRMGWDKAHAPKALPSPGQKARAARQAACKAED